MDTKIEDMNVADLVALWKDTDDTEVARAVVAELQARLTAEPENAAVEAALAEVSGEPGSGSAGPQAGAGGATEARTQGEQTWLVQSSGPGAGHGQMWTDVAEVSVPPRTKRKTIVEKALAYNPSAKPQQDVDGETLFRVLDADSAATIPVRWEVPPAPEPQLVIG